MRQFGTGLKLWDTSEHCFPCPKGANSQIVFYLLTVVLGYGLYHLFANTAAGARFANKTRQAIAFEQLKSRRTHVIVYAGGYFEIFETLSFLHLALVLSPSVQARLRHWLEDHLPQLAKRE